MVSFSASGKAAPAAGAAASSGEASGTSMTRLVTDLAGLPVRTLGMTFAATRIRARAGVGRAEVRRKLRLGAARTHVGRG